MSPKINEPKKKIDTIIETKKFGFNMPIIPRIGHNGAKVNKRT